jgi:polyisoprenoid-binding protein YceI
VLDASHTRVGFVARHLMVTKVRGNFEKVDARIRIGESPQESSAEAVIEIASIDTRDQKRDEHLRSADFFDVAKFPTMTFRSTHVEPAGGSHYSVTGDLTIRDQTHPVTLDVEYAGAAKTPWGAVAAGITASAEIDRERWGLTWNVALESGGFLASKKIQLEIEAEIGQAPAAVEAVEAATPA